MENVQKVTYRWVILAVYMLVTALSFMCWLTFASIETITENRLQLPNQIVVWLTHVFILCAFILSIPAGKWIDKWGFKTGVGIGVILMAVFSLFRFINTHSFLILMISQTGIALGQPFILNGVNKLVVNWFPKEEHATAIGLGLISLVIGDMIALGLTPHLVDRFSFEFMLYAYSIATCIGALLFFLLTKTRPQEASIIENHSIWSEIKEISKFRNFNFSTVVCVISNAIIVFFLTYFEKMLHEIQEMPTTTIGNLSIIFMLFSVAGGVIIPIVSDRVKNRKILLVITLILVVPAVGIFPFCSNFICLALSTSAAGFFLSASQPLIYTIAAETLKAKYAGFSVGYLQFLGSGGALLFIPFMAALRSLAGSFMIPIFILLLFVLASIFFAAKIKDTY